MACTSAVRSSGERAARETDHDATRRDTGTTRHDAAGRTPDARQPTRGRARRSRLEHDGRLDEAMDATDATLPVPDAANSSATPRAARASAFDIRMRCPVAGNSAPLALRYTRPKYLALVWLSSVTLAHLSFVLVLVTPHRTRDTAPGTARDDGRR